MINTRKISDTLKQILRRTPVYHALLKRRYLKEVRVWESRGCPVPVPHLIKQGTLLEYAKEYSLNVLVETGTYYGAMVEAMKNSFDQVYSIELDPYLYERARKRFRSAKNVRIVHGDSGTVLKTVVEGLNSSALFWLDAHYSVGVTARGDKDSPILEELDIILSTRFDGNVIIVDDAHAFGDDPAYPTLQELQQFLVARGKNNVELIVKRDSIRITPQPS